MLGSKRNRYECNYGCCTNGLKKRQYRRILRSREKAALRKEG